MPALLAAAPVALEVAIATGAVMSTGLAMWWIAKDDSENAAAWREMKNGMSQLAKSETWKNAFQNTKDHTTLAFEMSKAMIAVCTKSLTQTLVADGPTKVRKPTEAEVAVVLYQISQSYYSKGPPPPLPPPNNPPSNYGVAALASLTVGLLQVAKRSGILNEEKPPKSDNLPKVDRNIRERFPELTRLQPYCAPPKGSQNPPTFKKGIIYSPDQPDAFQILRKYLDGIDPSQPLKIPTISRTDKPASKSPTIVLSASDKPPGQEQTEATVLALADKLLKLKQQLRTAGKTITQAKKEISEQFPGYSLFERGGPGTSFNIDEVRRVVNDGRAGELGESVERYIQQLNAPPVPPELRPYREPRRIGPTPPALGPVNARTRTPPDVVEPLPEVVKTLDLSPAVEGRGTHYAYKPQNPDAILTDDDRLSKLENVLKSIRANPDQSVTLDREDRETLVGLISAHKSSQWFDMRGYFQRSDIFDLLTAVARNPKLLHQIIQDVCRNGLEVADYCSDIINSWFHQQPFSEATLQNVLKGFCDGLGITTKNGAGIVELTYALSANSGKLTLELSALIRPFLDLESKRLLADIFLVQCPGSLANNLSAWFKGEEVEALKFVVKLFKQGDTHGLEALQEIGNSDLLTPGVTQAKKDTIAEIIEAKTGQRPDPSTPFYSLLIKLVDIFPEKGSSIATSYFRTLYQEQIVPLMHLAERHHDQFELFLFSCNWPIEQTRSLLTQIKFQSEKLYNYYKEWWNSRDLKEELEEILGGELFPK